MARDVASRWLTLLCAFFGCLGVSCGHGKEQRRGDRLAGRQRRFVLIDAKRLPDAVVHRVGLKNLETPATADIDEMREALCGGLEEPLIFYQLVVSRHWHYYWLCSQDDPVRAMTPQGDRMLRAWLLQVQRRTLQSLRGCRRHSTRRIFSQQHASGVIARAYCDGVVLLFFPDGGEKSFEAHKGPLTATVRRGARRRSRRGTMTAEKEATEASPSASAECVEPNTVQACRAFGEKAFWQGVRKACAQLCPAIFRRCNETSPGNALCHELSEHCATLEGVCARDAK